MAQHAYPSLGPGPRSTTNGVRAAEGSPATRITGRRGLNRPARIRIRFSSSSFATSSKTVARDRPGRVSATCTARTRSAPPTIGAPPISRLRWVDRLTLTPSHRDARLLCDRLGHGEIDVALSAALLRRSRSKPWPRPASARRRFPRAPSCANASLIILPRPEAARVCPVSTPSARRRPRLRPRFQACGRTATPRRERS